MGFPRQVYWRGLPFPSPEDLPNLEIEPVSPALADRFFSTETPGKPRCLEVICQMNWASSQTHTVGFLSLGLSRMSGMSRAGGSASTLTYLHWGSGV